MNIDDLLKYCADNEIQLEVVDDRIKITAPEGAVSGQIREVIKANKLKLIDKIKKLKNASTSPRKIEKNELKYNLPLSYQQRRMWFLSHLSKGQGLYNIDYSFDMDEFVNIDALNKAFRSVIERHEILRTTYSIADNGEPVQNILSEQQFNITQLGDREYTLDDVDNIIDFEKKYDFDLDNEIPIRATIVRLENKIWKLIVVIHHIAFDGASELILIKEIDAHYQAEINDEPAPIEELSVQYKDYATWQREYLSKEGAHKLDFWREKLSDLKDVHSLPLDKPRPAKQSFNGSTVFSDIKGSLFEKLEEYSHQHSSTIFTTIIAAFSIFLRKYSGDKDTVIGTPISIRDAKEVKNLIGCFVNTLVLRNRVNDDLSFEDFLASVSRNTFEAFENKDVPFEFLVEDLGIERSLHHHPIFQVMIVMQNNKDGSSEINNAFDENFKGYSKFDLQLTIKKIHGGFGLYWEFNTDIFTRTSIQGMTHSFNSIISQVINDNKKIQDISFLLETPSEEVSSSAFTPIVANEYAQQKCLHHLIEERSNVSPDAIALKDAVQTLSYSCLNEKSNIIARDLISRGVLQESLIGVCLNKTVDLVVVLLGILKSGAAYVPIDPSYPQDRINYIIEDSQCDFAVVDKLGHAAIGENSKIDVIDIRSIDQSQYATTNIDLNIDNRQLAYVIYTSGSTGNPKGVQIEHKNIVSLLTCEGIFDDIDQDDIWILLHSYSFDFSVWEIFGSLANGSKLVIVDEKIRSNIESVAQNIVREKISILNQTPSSFYSLSELLLNFGFNNNELKYVIFGGEKLDFKRIENWARIKKDVALVNMFGITETTIHATKYEIDAFNTEKSIIGCGLPTHNLMILDENLDVCPTGVIGEIYVSGSCLARSYLNNPAVTASVFIPNPFAPKDSKNKDELVMYRSGDHAKKLSNGQIEYIGRVDNQVKVRGHRIELEEIESVIYRLFKSDFEIKASKVVVNLSSTGVQRIIGFIACKTVVDDEVKMSKQLLSDISKNIPSYMVPDKIIFCSELPLTKNGKVDTHYLETLKIDLSDNKSHVSAKNSVESMLCDIWNKLLGTENTSTTDDFFSSGGNSILAIKFVSELRSCFGVPFSVEDIFQLHTIQDISEFLISHRDVDPNNVDFSHSKTKEIVIEHDSKNRYEPFPLTEVQQAYWLGRKNDFDLGNVAAHIYFEESILSEEIKPLQDAWNLLVQRHDILRMVVTRDGQQRILKDVPEYVIHYEGFTNDRNANENLDIARKRLSHQVFSGEQWPLFELCVTLVNKNEAIVHASFDALVLDASSMKILAKDLNQLLKDIHTNLPPLDITFRDYVLALEDQRETASYLDAKKYWLDRVLTLPLGPDLPLAVDPSSIESPRFERRKHWMAHEQWRVLKAQANSLNVTPTVFLISCLSRIIHQWCQSSSFTLNLTLYNRMPLHPSVEYILGDFTSLSLLEINESEIFEDLVLTIQRQLLNDLEHKQFGGLEVQRALLSAGRKSNFPVVVTSTLALTDNFKPVIIEDEFNASPEIDNEEKSFGITQTSQVWLDIQIVEDNQNLIINWDSIEGLFPEKMLDEMFESFKDILLYYSKTEDKLDSYSRRIPSSNLDVINLVNNTYYNSTPVLLHENILEKVKIYPNKDAIVTKEMVLKYSDIDLYTQKLAIDISKLTTAHNELVAIVMDKGWEQVISAIAILRAGCAYLPIDALQPQKRIEKILEASGVKRVITTTSYAKIVSPDLSTIIIDETYFNSEKLTISPIEANELELKTATHNDLAYVIFTSGSTGTPKGVAIEHESALNTVADISRRFSITETDTVFGLSSLSFDLSVYDIFGILGAGGTLVIPSDSEYRDPVAWLEYLQSNSVTVWNSVPALIKMLTEFCLTSDYDNNQCTLSGLRLILLSGDWVPIDLPKKISTFAPNGKIISMGGATEASIWSNIFEIKSFDFPLGSVPYGMPLTNQNMYIMHEDLSLCPFWVTGDIYIGGIGLAREYWNNPKQTAASFFMHPITRERLYKTGDKGRILPDGNIEFLGRIDSQVKIQGHRIELGEVESSLKLYPDVFDSVALTFDTDGNINLGACLVLQDSESSSDVGENNLLEFKMSNKSIRQLECKHIDLKSFDINDILTLNNYSSPKQDRAKVDMDIIQLSELLKVFYRYQSPHSVNERGLYPSAGSLYPVQVYLRVFKKIPMDDLTDIQPGWYYLNPITHSLAALTESPIDESNVLCNDSLFELHFVGEFDAIDAIYGDNSRLLMDLEAGYMGFLFENHQAAENYDIFGKCRYDHTDDICAELMLSETQVPIYSYSISHKANDSGSPVSASEFEKLFPVGKEESETGYTLALIKSTYQCDTNTKKRRSYRNYLNETVSFEDISALLSEVRYVGLTLNRLNDIGVYLRIHRDIQDLENNINFHVGSYRYDVVAHTLTKINSDQDGGILTGINKDLETNSSFGIYFSCAENNSHATNNLITQSLVNIGYLCQLLSTYYIEKGIGICSIGGVDKEAAQLALNLGDNDSIVHGLVGGRVDISQDYDVVIEDDGAQFYENISLFLSERLPRHMIPSEYKIIDKIPLTANGKVDRKSLGGFGKQKRERVFCPPEGEKEEILAQIWQSLLNVTEIDRSDNFLGLGGNSLLVVRLIISLEKHNYLLTVQQVFEAVNLSELAKLMIQENKIKSSIPERISLDRENELTPSSFPLLSLSQKEISCLIESLPGGASNIVDAYPLSHLQEGIYFHVLLNESRDPYLLTMFPSINSPDDVGRIEEAIKHLITRHEVLRTTIISENLDTPVQVVLRDVDFDFTHIQLNDVIDSRLSDEAYAHEMVKMSGIQNLNMDLAQAPLIRGIVISSDGSRNPVVVIQMHHIICDITSARILQKEMLEYVENKKLQDNIGELFRNHIASNRLESTSSKTQEFFTDLLSDVEETTAPFGITDINGSGADLLEAQLSLGYELSEKISEKAKLFNVTPSIMFHIAWAMVISRLTGKQDVVFGTVMSGRMNNGFENSIGMYINTLPFRVNLAGKISDILNDAHVLFSNIVAHENTSLVLAQRCSSIPSGSPLFTSVINYRNTNEVSTAENTESENEKTEVEINQSMTAEKSNYPLVLSVDNSGREFRLVISALSTIDIKSVSEFVSHAIQSLTEALDKSIDNSIEHVETIPDTYWDRFYPDRGNTAEYDKRAIHTLIESRAKTTPDAVALVYGDVNITYQYLDERANAIAKKIIEANILPCSLVGISVERSPLLIFGILGILKSGCAYVPIESSLSQERITYIVNDSKIDTILTDTFSSHALRVDSSVNFIDIGIDSDEVVDIDDIKSHVTSDQPCYVIYTSGSTGKPKGVLIEHRNLVSLINSEAVHEDITHDDTWILLHSYCFDFSVWEIFGALTKGSRLVILGEERQDLLHVNDVLVKQKVSVLGQTPTSFYKLSDIYLENKKSSHSLQYIIFGGEKLDASRLLDWYLAKPDVQLINMYGITETTIHTTRYDLKGNDFNTPDSCIGRSLNSHDIFILDDNLNLCPVGVSGEICVVGECLSTGYINSPSLTAEKFIPNPFSKGIHSSASNPRNRLYRSGDIGKLMADGSIEYIGRKDAQVKIRGYRVDPSEIENCIIESEYNGVKVNGCVVVPRTLTSDETSNELLVAFVVTHINSTKENKLISDIRDSMSMKLPSYMVPSVVVLIESIPLTSNGKIDINYLKEIPVDVHAGKKFRKAESEQECILASIISITLNIDEVGIDESFFELGGDSISAIQVVSRANQAGIHFTVRDILEKQNIQSILICANLKKQHIDIDQSPVVSELIPTPVQKRFLRFKNATKYHFNQSLYLEAPTGLDINNARLLVELLIHRHDVLRLRYDGSSLNYIPIEEINIDDIFESKDYSHCEENEIEHEIELNNNKVQQSVSIYGPMFKTVFYTSAGNNSRLLLIAHHMVVDAVSWRIIFDDLNLAFKQSTLDKPLELDLKTTSFNAWSERIHRYALSDTCQSQKDYWLSQITESKPEAATDKDMNLSEKQCRIIADKYEVSEHSNSITSTMKATLSKAATHELLTYSLKASRSKIDEVLIAGVYIAIQNFLAEKDRKLPEMRIDLERHGRDNFDDEINLSSTVGWFTTIFPLKLGLTDRGHVLDVINSVKNSYRGVPDNGIGFGALKYLTDDKDIIDQDNHYAPIVFNYFGRFEDGSNDQSHETDDNNDVDNNKIDSIGNKKHTFDLLNKKSGVGFSESLEREYLLGFNGLLSSGQLVFIIDYNKLQFETESIECISKHFEKALLDIVSACSEATKINYAYSDFPLATLSQDYLNKIQADKKIENLYPATPMQLGMLSQGFIEKEFTYIVQCDFLLTGHLNRTALQEAWRYLINRHEIFRTSFVISDYGQMLQVVSEESSIEWFDIDLRGMDSKIQKESIQEYYYLDKCKEFDLNASPLMRFTTFLLSEKETYCLWTFHHALLDGWSTPIVMEELFRVYEALNNAHTITLTNVTPYVEYIKYLRSQDENVAREYWSERLSSIHEPTRLSAQDIDIDHNERTHGVLEFSLDVEITQNLEKLASRSGVTLSTVVQSAWAYFLYRYLNQENVVFGVTNSGRPADIDGIGNMVGLFVTTCPNSIRIDLDKTLESWLGVIQANNIQSSGYEFLPLNQIMAQSSVQGLELFDSLVVFESYPTPDDTESSSDSASPHEFTASDTSEGISIESFTIKDATNYPMTLFVLPEKVMKFRFSYHKSKFYSHEILDMKKNFVSILESMSHAQNELLRSIEMDISHDFRHEHSVLSAFSTTNESLDKPQDDSNILLNANVDRDSVVDVIHSISHVYPNSTAVIYDGVELSYQELDIRSNQLAHYLIESGVGVGAYIAVSLERSCDVVVTLLAVMKVGAAYIPIDPNFPADRIRYVLENSHAQRLITSGECLDDSLSFYDESKIIRIDRQREKIETRRDCFPDVTINGSDIAYMIYTSGSTGKPKGVQIQHKALVSFLQSMLEVTLVNHASRWLAVTSLSFDISALELYLPLCVGGAVIVSPSDVPKDPMRLFDTIMSNECTHLQATPVTWEMLDNLPKNQMIPIKGLVGGEALSCTLANNLRSRDVRLTNMYGPTETTIWSSSYDVIDPIEGNYVPIGFPLKGETFFILNDSLMGVPLGRIGELCIGGSGLSKGYFEKDELTQERFIHNPYATASNNLIYRTGDLVRFTHNGDIEFVGRADDQVKIRGYRIELGEIESVLLSQENVAAATVVKTSEQNNLVAYVKLLNCSADESVHLVDELLKHLANTLPAYMVPTSLIVLDELPLTPNNKVDKKALSQRLLSQKSDVYAAPETEIEKRIQTIWCTVLRISDKVVGIDSHFLDLGGNSLLIVNLISEIRIEFGCDISMRTVFNALTIRQLAQVVCAELSKYEESQNNEKFEHEEIF